MALGSTPGAPKHPTHLTNVNFARTPEELAAWPPISGRLDSVRLVERSSNRTEYSDEKFPGGDGARRTKHELNAVAHTTVDSCSVSAAPRIAALIRDCLAPDAALA